MNRHLMIIILVGLVLAAVVLVLGALSVRDDRLNAPTLRPATTVEP